jgi:hypothetical protein
VVLDQKNFFGHNQRKKREKREERENGKYLFICEEREKAKTLCVTKPNFLVLVHTRVSLLPRSLTFVRMVFIVLLRTSIEIKEQTNYGICF